MTKDERELLLTDLESMISIAHGKLSDAAALLRDTGWNPDLLADVDTAQSAAMDALHAVMNPEEETDGDNEEESQDE